MPNPTLSQLAPFHFAMRETPAPPEFVSQTGASAGNQAYARAFVETARRAVLRCAPLELPDDLYSYWREFELNFDPRLMT